MLASKHRLPGAVALAALLIYGVTLCWGTTANGLALTANVAGWDWQPLLDQPLTWLLTLPLRILPTAWIPAGLNLFLALCAALTLGILARSVELLPWDCLPPKNRNWVKILPVLLAAGVCGLEFNFWHEATAGAGAMVNQLLLAAAIGCLLEYRAAKASRWLNAAAVIWGLGLTQNWVMQLCLPIFIAALIALRGKRFLKWSFLLRMALLGLAGFSIYALPAIFSGLNPHCGLSLGAAWLATLKASKGELRLLFFGLWTQHRLLTLVVILFYLVPILSALVRLPDRGSKNKSKLERFQLRLYRLVRGALLVACLWLAFEPSVGPQQILQHQFGAFLPLLSFTYLNALGIAYLAGNLLFALQVRPEPGKLRGRARKINSWRRRSVPVLFAGAFTLVLFALAGRNAPAIWAGNRQPLENFGTLAAAALPPEGGILLGDDMTKLTAVQAALAHVNRGPWLTVDLPALATADYRAALERQQPLGWLTASNKHDLNALEQYRLLEQLAHARRIFCLSLVPGQLVLEQFYLQPAGPVAELKLFEPFQSSGPPLPAATLDEVEKNWNRAWSEKMSALVPAATQSHSVWCKMIGRLDQHLALAAVPDLQSRQLADWYSTALDEWGVQLQRHDRLPAAQRRFEQALALSTNNLCARVNLECNTNFQAGRPLNLAGIEALGAQFNDLTQLARVMGQFGPMDQPAVCFLFGRECQLAGLPRQALQQLDRANRLAPAELPPKLAQAEIYSRYRQDDQVFERVKTMRSNLKILPAAEADPVSIELDVLEAKAWMSQTNAAKARGILQFILERHPNDPAAQSLVLSAYLSFGDLTNALQFVTRRLAAAPDNTDYLNQQAGILMELNQPQNALAVLDRALALTNLPNLRLNHALACLQSGNLPQAEAEYRQLGAEPPDAFLVHLGLATIAERRQDTNLAIHQLEICLTNAPVGSARWAESRARLTFLKATTSVQADKNSPHAMP